MMRLFLERVDEMEVIIGCQKSSLKSILPELTKSTWLLKTLETFSLEESYPNSVAFLMILSRVASETLFLPPKARDTKPLVT